MEGAEKIAKIIRADKHSISRLQEKMAKVTGKFDVMDKIMEENDGLIRKHLQTLGVPVDARAKEVYDALISKIESDDLKLFNALGNPVCTKQGDCQNVSEAARRIAGNPKGFFIKHDKIREFLIKEPPRKIMSFLGYDSAEKMLAQEDLMEIMSALRFVEGSDWLNGVFFKQYEFLTPSDFEEREIEVRALGEKWGAESEKFVLKKKHNISHLKEAGIVFVIPVMLGISGEILRMFALILHYLYEIPFYSNVARDASREPQTFAQNYISLLRGDVIEKPFLATDDRTLWLVVQRYLAKDDENDWRLFAPHINPEAMHWQKAVNRLVSAGEVLDHFKEDLSFWRDVDWLGDYFKDESGVDVLVSFDLVDTVMSLVKEKELVKYLYHHEEALWNKIFTAYFDKDQLEEHSRKYLLQGYFEI